MTRRIKVKANAMEDADVRFVSLVSRPASRLPFRVLKADEPDQENGLMINLSRMFKRDGDATDVGVTLVGVVLQKEHRDHFAPELEKLGLKTDDVIENDEGDVLIFRQCEYSDEDVVAIKLNELGGLFVNVPEVVSKAFDPFMESDDFDTNMSLQFLPGMAAATEALMTSVYNVLRSADDASSARERISTNIDMYKQSVMDMAAGLPEVAFKIESLTLDGFEPQVEEAVKEEVTEEEAPTEAAAEEPAEEPVAKDEEGEQEPEQPEAAVSADAAADADALKEKGVHIEGDGAQDIKNPEVTEASTEAEGDKPADAAVEKSEGEDDKADDALVAKMSEILEAVSGVRTEVADLKKSHGELADKVSKAEETAEAARKAVKGTVPSSSDNNDRVVDESLGTHRRNRKSDADVDEQAWGGTSLDRIVGDFGS